ncbi:MAG: type II secretion system protein GspD [Limisphaerales bacterium]
MKNTTLQIIKRRASLWAALCLCWLTLPLLAQTRAGGGGGGGGGGNAGRSSAAGTGTSTIDRPGNGQVGTANFYVDPDSRMLFVVADDATAGYVSNVVANLNRPKPQVLIKVVFLEVTYNKGMDVGVEGQITKRINASTVNSNSSLFGLAQQGTSPNSVSPVNTLPGAGMFTIQGNDFSATLRAIAEVGKVEVLSRPTILARNNQMAQITVGQNVPLINGVNYDVYGNEHIAIQYTSVGIILQVTPFITPDGMVEMILAPQISAVDPSQSQVIAYATNGSAVSAPYIDIRSANTVVVTPDGQTVVIGGLMQNNRSSTDSKIPILGDIPVLGQLFHHKLTSSSKTELIILLTPFVVKTPADLARMSLDERGRATLSPKAFSQQEMNQFIGTGQSNAPPSNVPIGTPVTPMPQRPR